MFSIIHVPLHTGIVQCKPRPGYRYVVQVTSLGLVWFGFLMDNYPTSEQFAEQYYPTVANLQEDAGIRAAEPRMRSAASAPCFA